MKIDKEKFHVILVLRTKAELLNFHNEDARRKQRQKI